MFTATTKERMARPAVVALQAELDAAILRAEEAQRYFTLCANQAAAAEHKLNSALADVNSAKSRMWAAFDQDE